MGSVTFGGTTQDYSIFEVFDGYPLCSSSYTSYVKNCANYGDVKSIGTTGFNSYMGMFVGEIGGSSSRTVLITAQLTTWFNYS